MLGTKLSFYITFATLSILISGLLGSCSNKDDNTIAGTSIHIGNPTESVGKDTLSVSNPDHSEAPSQPTRPDLDSEYISSSSSNVIGNNPDSSRSSTVNASSVVASSSAVAPPSSSSAVSSSSDSSVPTVSDSSSFVITIPDPPLMNDQESYLPIYVDFTNKQGARNTLTIQWHVESELKSTPITVYGLLYSYPPLTILFDTLFSEDSPELQINPATHSNTNIGLRIIPAIESPYHISEIWIPNVADAASNNTIYYLQSYDPNSLQLHIDTLSLAPNNGYAATGVFYMENSPYSHATLLELLTPLGPSNTQQSGAYSVISPEGHALQVTVSKQ
jgi:hypothetical protein